MYRKHRLLTCLALFALIFTLFSPLAGHAADPVADALSRCAQSRLQDKDAIETVFRHLDITTKADEAAFLRKVRAAAKGVKGVNPRVFESEIRAALDKKRFNTVNALLKKVYKEYGKGLDVVVRTGSSGIRYLELEGKRRGHAGYRLLFSDDDISFVGEKAVQAAKYFNQLVEKEGLEALKVKGFDIVHLKNIRGIDLHLLNLLEEEKFVGEAAMAGIKKEMLIKGAVIAENESGKLVSHAESLSSYIKDKTSSILANEFDEKLVREAVRKHGAMTMVGSCERQVTGAHGGWEKLSDPEKVKYVLRERIALEESGALGTLAKMSPDRAKQQIEYLKKLKAKGKLTKGDLRWLRKLRANNIELVFEHIPYKLNPIIAKARASGRSLAGSPEARKALDELTVGFVLMSEHILDVPEKQILAKLRQMAGGNRDLYKMLYTSFMDGKALSAALDAWLGAGLSREAFVELLLKAEGKVARLRLINERRAALKKGVPEAKALREAEMAVSSQEGDRFLVKLLKSPTGRKVFIGVMVSAGGAYIFKKMYHSYMAGHLDKDLSNAAMALVEFIPGVSGFKLWHEEGLTPRVVFSFVKEALYFTPAWPLVLTGDVVSIGVDVGAGIQLQHNNNGLVDILVYAGEYDKDGRFKRLVLPKAAANQRRVINKAGLEDFFFKTGTVVVPVSGMNNTYRISNLTKVSNEILDQVFIENDPVTTKLRKAAETQLTKVSHHESWKRIEKGNPFSGIFEYAKCWAGFSTVCEKSPHKWCKFFRLLQKKIEARRKFVKSHIMVSTLVRTAEEKHAHWAMGAKPPVKELAKVQKRLENLREKPLGVDLVKEVDKRADAAAAKAAGNGETREVQTLEKGKYWQAALQAYTHITRRHEKMVNSLSRKFNFQPEKIRRGILRFSWSGDYVRDAQNAAASLKGFYHGAWRAWLDVQKIKGSKPDPSEEAIDRQALSTLAEVQLRWRMALDAGGRPSARADDSRGFNTDYKKALAKVRALYKEKAAFQVLVAREATITHGSLILGKQVRFAVKITGKNLRKIQDGRHLRVEWRSAHGDFGSRGRGVRVNFATTRLLPVTVEAVIRDMRKPMVKGILSVTVPVRIPKGTFRLALTPANPAPGEFVRAEVEMPDRYLNAYKFHYAWRGKGCRVEGRDHFYVLVTAPKKGKATVFVRITAEDKKGKRIFLADAGAAFGVKKGKTDQPAEEPKKRQKTDKKKETAKVSGAETGPIEPEKGASESAPKVSIGEKQRKKKVRHGTGGSATGMYPAEAFNGLQISYSVSGASMPKMKDMEGFTCSRHYEGRLGNGTLKIAGTAGSSWHPYVTLSVSVSAGEKHAERTYEFKSPGSRSFSLSVPIPKDATSGGFAISMSASYGNGEDRGLVVSGSFTDDGPEGKSPKGTEDLKVEIAGPKKPVASGEKAEITAKIRGGRFPYTYHWVGAKGTGKKAVFQSSIAGPSTVTLNVTDVDGRAASGSVKVTVQAPEFEITGLPSRPVYASIARLRVRVKGGKKGKFKPIWQASEPGIAFDPPEGMETTVTFGRVKEIAVWVQVPMPNGGKTLESKQVHAQVVGPKFTVTLNPKEPYVGREVRAEIKSSAKMPPDAIRWVWASPPSSNRREYDDPASRIGFVMKNPDTFTLQAEARVPHYGDVIGKIQKKVKARPYDVKVKILGPLGPKPMIWKEGKGLVEAGARIAVHQNIRMAARVTPKPKGAPLRYTWTLNEDSHFAGGSSSKEITVNRSRTGTCVAEVTVRDKNGVILGKGKGTFSVEISQEEINQGKNRKVAHDLFKRARSLYGQKKCDEALDTLEKAANLAPENGRIKTTLEAWRQAKALGKKLEGEGALLEAADDLTGAVKKYRESLKQWPNEKLSRHAAALRKTITRREARAKEEKKAAEEKKRVAQNEKKANKEKKPLSIEDVLPGEKADGQSGKKPLSIEDVLPEKGKSAKTPSSPKAAGAGGSKPLSIDDVLPGKPAAKTGAEQGGKGAKQTTRPSPGKMKNMKVIAAAGVSGNTLRVITLSLDSGLSKIVQLVVTEASEKTARGGTDSARVGEVTFYAKGRKITPVRVVSDSNAGHGYSAKQAADGIEEFSYRELGAKGWASAPLRKRQTAWLMFHFSRPVDITRVVVVTAPTRPYRLYSFQVRKYAASGSAAVRTVKHTGANQAEKRRDTLIREGYSAETAGRLEAAIQKYRQAQKIRYDEKVAAHIRRLRAKIDAFDTLLRQGYGYEKKGYLSKAIAVYKKALKIHGDKKVAAHIRALERKMAAATKPTPGTPGKTRAGSSVSSAGATTLKRGIWVLDRIEGRVGRAKRARKGDYYRSLVSGREGRIVMTNTIKKNGHVIFKTLSTWQRPPARLVPKTKIAIPLVIHKLADPREYSENHGLSVAASDLDCGGIRAGESIGGVGVYSVHSPKNPTVKKTFRWTVPEGRSGKKLTLRFCWSGVSYETPHGWKYHYRWVPAGTPLPKTSITAAPPSQAGEQPASRPSGMKTRASSKFKANSRGDVFRKGHWVGARGGSDWIQRNFGRVIPISKIYIKRASTDVTTRGFRLILKLRRPVGTWVKVDELHDTNINRSKLSNGRIGVSIPPYTKNILPPVRATAFRLEFYGHGWFDAEDIRLYTPRKSISGKKNKRYILLKTIFVSRDQNLFPDPGVKDDQADSNNFVIDGNQSKGWVWLLFRDKILYSIADKSVRLRLEISSVKSAASGDGFIIYSNNGVVGKIGKVSKSEIVEIPLDTSRLNVKKGILKLKLRAAGDDAAYVLSKASGRGAQLKIYQLRATN